MRRVWGFGSIRRLRLRRSRNSHILLLFLRRLPRRRRHRVLLLRTFSAAATRSSPPPDWLREYQAPSQDFITIPSCSDSSPEVSPKRYDDTPYRLERSPKQEDSIYIDSAEGTPVKAKAVKTKGGSFAKAKKSKALKSDDTNVKEEEQIEELAEEDLTEKSAGPPVSSRLPLSFLDKVQRMKALVECDGDSIDLSGDVGAVGRIVI